MGRLWARIEASTRFPFCGSRVVGFRLYGKDLGGQKRTDLIWHIDSFLVFFSLTPVTLFFFPGGAFSSRRRVTDTTAMTPFLFHTMFSILYTKTVGAEEFFTIQATKGAGLEPGTTKIPPGV
jgi:hypothetical protein